MYFSTKTGSTVIKTTLEGNLTQYEGGQCRTAPYEAENTTDKVLSCKGLSRRYYGRTINEYQKCTLMAGRPIPFRHGSAARPRPDPDPLGLLKEKYTEAQSETVCYQV